MPNSSFEAIFTFFLYSIHENWEKSDQMKYAIKNNYPTH